MAADAAGTDISSHTYDKENPGAYTSESKSIGGTCLMSLRI